MREIFQHRVQVVHVQCQNVTDFKRADSEFVEKRQVFQLLIVLSGGFEVEVGVIEGPGDVQMPEMISLANLDKDTVPEAGKDKTGFPVPEEEDLCQFISLLIHVALFADKVLLELRNDPREQQLLVMALIVEKIDLNKV
jgi:hypothetical protein